MAESLVVERPFVSTRIGAAEMLSDNQKCGRVADANEEAADAVLDLLSEDSKELELQCKKTASRLESKKYSAN